MEPVRDLVLLANSFLRHRLDVPRGLRAPGFRCHCRDDATGERSASQSVFFCCCSLVSPVSPALSGCELLLHSRIEVALGGGHFPWPCGFFTRRRRWRRRGPVFLPRSSTFHCFLPRLVLTKIMICATVNRLARAGGFAGKACFAWSSARGGDSLLLPLASWYISRASPERSCARPGAAFQLINQDGAAVWLPLISKGKSGSPISFSRPARSVPDHQQPDERVAEAARENGRASGLVQRRSGKGYAGSPCAATPRVCTRRQVAWIF